MKFDKLSDFLSWQTHCVFCQCPMPLLFKDWRGDSFEESVPCSMDKVNNKLIVDRTLEINLNNNTYTSIKFNRNSQILAKTTNAKKFSISRKCQMCNSHLKIGSLPMKFNSSGLIEPVELNHIRFQYVEPQEKNIDRITISSDYQNDKTTIMHYKLVGDTFVPTLTHYQEFPLINFDWSCKNKIVQKIKMITLFS